MATNESDVVLTHQELALCGLMVKTVSSMVLVFSMSSKGDLAYIQ